MLAASFRPAPSRHHFLARTSTHIHQNTLQCGEVVNVPFLYWLDITGFGLCIVIGSASVLALVGAGFRRVPGPYLILFMLCFIAWTVCGMLCKLALWIEVGNPQLLTETAGFFFTLQAPLLYVFSAEYTGQGNRYHRLFAWVGIIVMCAAAVPLFGGRIVHDVRLSDKGITVQQISRLGFAVWAVPVLYFLGATVQFLRTRQIRRQSYLGVSSSLFIAGLALQTVAGVPFPFISLSCAVAAALIGYDVMKRQLFNPLRDLAAELERTVSEHIKTEASLRESEQHFRNLAENSPNMIFINSMGRVVYANHISEQMTGYTREEFYSPDFDFMVLIAPEDKQRVVQRYQKHTAGQEVPPYEYSIITKSGDTLNVINSSRLMSYHGRRAILGVVTDISEQKRTEHLLRTLNDLGSRAAVASTEEELFQTVGDGFSEIPADCAIFTIGEDARRCVLRYYTHETPLRRTVRETTGTEPEQLAVPAYADLPRRIMRTKRAVLVDGRQALEELLRSILPFAALEVADRLRPHNTVVAPLLTDNDTMGFLCVSSEALTENDVPGLGVFAHQLAAALARIRAVQELKTSINRLQETRDQLNQSQKLEAVGRLASGIAHDFNNILTAISGYTDLLLLDDSLSKDVRRDLQGIKTSVVRASQLTSQLLAFSRKQVMNPAVVDVNRLVTNLQRMLSRIISSDYELRSDLLAQDSHVRADPNQLEQVVVNLVVNARDAMPKSGTITVRTTNQVDEHPEITDDEPRGFLVLSVSDTGTGIDPEVRRRIFEPFFTTKESGKGTGLGLATAHGIVAQSGGFIRVHSTPGEGSVFSVYLPTVSAPAETAPVHRNSVAVSTDSRTILVVDDEPVVLEIAGRVLREAGFRVITAHNAAEARIQADKHPQTLTLLITDVVMPGNTSGVDLTRELRGRFPNIPVIFVSGYRSSVPAELTHPNANGSFLQKPFGREELIEAVADLLD